MKNSIFWDITTCMPLKINRRFGGKCYPHLQGRRINRARNQHEAGSKKKFFHPEDGGNKFLWNSGWVSTAYTVLYPRRQNLNICISLPFFKTRRSVVGWGTMLQARRSRFGFPMSSLNFSIDLILPATLWPRGRLGLLTEMSIRNLIGGKGRPARKGDNLTAICEPTV
jgi:hypothetical protein